MDVKRQATKQKHQECAWKSPKDPLFDYKSTFKERLDIESAFPVHHTLVIEMCEHKHVLSSTILVTVFKINRTSPHSWTQNEFSRVPKSAMQPR